MRHARSVEPGPLSLLAAVLEGTADLSGAACIGHPELFDALDPDEPAEDAEYRHRAALRLCSTCPALTRCEQWANTQPTQNDSVIAGRTPEHGQRGRPRKEIA